MKPCKEEYKITNRPDTGTCPYCGSLDGDIVMSRLEKGDIILTPTDKNYKVYVQNDGGKPFDCSHRVDKSRSLDQTEWCWVTTTSEEMKFYFEHFTEEQKDRFLELLNAKKIKLNYPGYFYNLPYFLKESNATL